MLASRLLPKAAWEAAPAPSRGTWRGEEKLRERMKARTLPAAMPLLPGCWAEILIGLSLLFFLGHIPESSCLGFPEKLPGTGQLRSQAEDPRIWLGGGDTHGYKPEKLSDVHVGTLS